LTAVFGHFPYGAHAPTGCQGTQLPNHATSFAKQLHDDLQARDPRLEGVPDNEFTIGELFNDGSTLRLELANFDFATMRHQTLTNERSPHPLSRNLPTQPLELEMSFGEAQCPVGNYTRRFECAAAVVCHLRKSVDTAYSTIQPLSALVVASICPFCLSRFTNKWTTVKHL
jgi:hypothetical protein